jgi:membrane fusion protein
MADVTVRAGRETRSLFRAEALDCSSGPAYGSPLIAAPASFSLVAFTVCAIAVTLVALLVFGRYTQRETVSGYIAVADGDVRVYPQAAGTVAELLVTEGQLVTAGSPMFSMLTGRNEGLPTGASREVLDGVLAEKAALGGQAQEQISYFAAEAQRLRQALLRLDERMPVLQRQVQLALQKNSIRQRDLQRTREVHRRGHLSKRDLDAAEVAAIDGQLALDTARLQISDFESARQEIRSQFDQLQNQERLRLAEIAEAAGRLAQRQSAVQAAVTQTVVAPVDGRVSVLHIITGQTVTPDTLALSLLPASAQYYAELFVPGRSIGLLDETARVQLRFDSYPFEKYGLYGATIERIARSLLLPGDVQLPVPVVEPVYRVRAALDRQHVQIDGAPRALTAGLTLKADILVSERSLLEWLLAPVISAGSRI